MMREINRRTVLLAAAVSPIVAACGEPEIRRRQSSPIALANVSPWGVNTFLDLEVETWKRRQTLRMISDAGIRWMKQHVPWADLEAPSRGEYFDASARRSTWIKYDENGSQELSVQVKSIRFL